MAKVVLAAGFAILAVLLTAFYFFVRLQFITH